MSAIEDISGGFRGAPRTVDEWLRRALANPKLRKEAERIMDEMEREQARAWAGSGDAERPDATPTL